MSLRIVTSHRNQIHDLAKGRYVILCAHLPIFIDIVMLVTPGKLRVQRPPDRDRTTL